MISLERSFNGSVTKCDTLTTAEDLLSIQFADAEDVEDICTLFPEQAQATRISGDEMRYVNTAEDSLSIQFAGAEDVEDIYFILALPLMIVALVPYLALCICRWFLAFTASYAARL